MSARFAPFAAICCLGLAVLSLAACGKGDEAEPGSDAASSLAVTLVPATRRDIQRTVLVSGPVAAVEEMQLGVEISGARVTALNVDVGQAVKRGDVLLELDHRSLDSELQQADAGLAEAEAGVALARANVARSEPLVKDRYVSAAQLDELRAARTQAEARRNTARAARDAARLRRDFAQLRAPANGIISKRLVQPGQVVLAGSELLRMIRDGKLEWRAELPQGELARVSPGAEVELPSPDGVVTGRIRAVSPGVDSETRTGTIYADLPGRAPDAALQPGTYVEGRIVTGNGSALMVPAGAVVQRDGHAYVFIVDGKKTAHRLRVRTGATVDGHVEVIEGLKAGANVVDQGAGFLGDGDPVRVVDAQSPPAQRSAKRANAP